MILESWKSQVRPEHTALVMIDCQNDLVSPSGWVMKNQIAEYDGDTGHGKAMERVELLLAHARDADVLRVFVRMIGDDRYLSDPLRAIFKSHHNYTSPPCTLEGTWGAEWVDGLKPTGGDREIEIEKHRFSAFAGTRLDMMLRSHNIRTVVFSGSATSGCVESSWRDAFMHDYYVVVVGDAVADYERARHDASLRKAEVGFGHVVSSSEICDQWREGESSASTRSDEMVPGVGQTA